MRYKKAKPSVELAVLGRHYRRRRRAGHCRCKYYFVHHNVVKSESSKIFMCSMAVLKGIATGGGGGAGDPGRRDGGGESGEHARARGGNIRPPSKDLVPDGPRKTGRRRQVTYNIQPTLFSSKTIAKFNFWYFITIPVLLSWYSIFSEVTYQQSYQRQKV